MTLASAPRAYLYVGPRSTGVSAVPGSAEPVVNRGRDEPLLIPFRGIPSCLLQAQQAAVCRPAKQFGFAGQFAARNGPICNAARWRFDLKVRRFFYVALLVLFWTLIVPH